ncbi:hypothetical protein ALC60_04436 [Trachymyrmex zeteki]|uniref:Uncharacterized protein n=1 Tax=Mycetomoellerius zeteki TaxID=64791 RepID=A0A151X8D0_9HYME|nr:hypothetical protein ALC60_04436 [Trachymyrmex zeteki]
MADVREREKIAREIEKTSESIRKKHRALKTGRIEECIALDRHFKPLIESLRLFVDNSGVRATKRESRGDDYAASAPKRQRKEEEKGEEASEPSATLSKSDQWHDVQPIAMGRRDDPVQHGETPDYDAVIGVEENNANKALVSRDVKNVNGWRIYSIAMT